MYNISMTNFCNHCGLCCKLIPAINGNIIRDGKQPIEKFFIPISIDQALNINENYVKKVQSLFPEAKFYTCKYVSENKQCTNSHMPESCINYPSSPLAIIPDECGFSGEIFIKYETLKQKIRKLKEEIVHYESLIITNPKEKNNYKKIIDSHNRFIKKYEQFGSLNW